MASSPITSWQIDGKKWKQWQILFSWNPKSLWTVTAAMILEDALLGRKAMTNLDSILKSRHHFVNKVPYSQSYGFPSSHIQMWALDQRRLCARELMLLTCGAGEDCESPLDSKEIKPVNPKGNQSWIFIGRTDAEAPILWPPDVKSRLIGKDPDAGKDWRQEEKRAAEDKMVK